MRRRWSDTSRADEGKPGFRDGLAEVADLGIRDADQAPRCVTVTHPLPGPNGPPGRQASPLTPADTPTRAAAISLWTRRFPAYPGRSTAWNISPARARHF